MRPLAVARLVSVLSLLPVTAIAQVPLGSEFLVNTYTIGTQGVARVASEDGGDFVVVWAGSPAYPSGFGYFTHIHGQRFASSGSALGSEFQISTYTALADPRGHAVASDSDGDFVVVWAHQSAPLVVDVIGQRFDSNGAALGAEFQVSLVTGAYQAQPAAAMEADGDFVVVWTRASGPGAAVQLHNGDNASCWEAVFTPADVLAGGAGKYKAKAP
jgi:hypothetical protein